MKDEYIQNKSIIWRYFVLLGARGGQAIKSLFFGILS